MKNILLLICTLILSTSTSFGQWEYTYFSLKFGTTSTYITPQQTTAPYLLLKNENGNYEKIFTAKEKGINPDYNLKNRPFGEIQINYDFENNRGGLIGAINYTSFTLSQNFYLENSSKVQLTRDLTIHSIGIPIMIKLGKGIFDYQRYFFGGIQFNFNKAITITETAAWSNKKYTQLVTNNQFLNQNFQFILGYNYLIFNIEADYLPGSFLNKNYINENKIAIYSLQKNDILYFKFSITLPFTPWLSTKNYQLYKLKHRIIFWK